MALIKETGAGVEGANSYVDLSDASAYFADRLHTSTWDNSDDATRTKALLMGATLLEGHVKWNGTKANTGQPLAFPRYGLMLMGIDGSTIPNTLKMAQCELALILLSKDLTALDRFEERNSAERIAELEIKRASSEPLQVIPGPVMALLAGLGRIKGGFGIMERVR